MSTHQSATAVEADTETYPRENFWGESGSDDGLIQGAACQSCGETGWVEAYNGQTLCPDCKADAPEADPTPDPGSQRGTDPAEWVAREIIRINRDPLCARTLNEPPYNGGRLGELCAWLFEGESIDGRPWELHVVNEEIELSGPEIHLAKDHETRFGPVEYGQYRHRRRVNPKTGYINFGESTGNWYQDVPLDQLLTEIREWLAKTRPAMEEWKREQALSYAREMKQAGNLRDVDILTNVVRKVRENEFER